LTKEKIMVNINSYWLMKAVNCIVNPELVEDYKKETITELFYSMIEKDYYKKINLMQKLLDIEKHVPIDSEYRKSWEKEVEYLSIDIQAIKKWLENHIHLKEKNEKHYSTNELLRMFKK